MSQEGSSQDPFGKPSPFDDENPFRENPYSSPELPPGAMPGAVSPYGRPGGRGMVGHVQPVAILMIAQGVLESLMGILLLGMAFFIPFMMRGEFQNQQVQGQRPPPEVMTTLMGVMYGGFGLLVLIVAALHVFAGFRNYGFRSRTLGIVALIAGMAGSLFTCYCAPTAIAVGVYGLICYLNMEVHQAFMLRESGKTKEEILETFHQ